MGMPVSVEVEGSGARTSIERVFEYFAYVDATFSTYKPDSEISRINRGEIAPHAYSADMREIFRLAEETKRETHGFFDIRTPQGAYDPSGIVKGWAIKNAADLLRSRGCGHFYLDVGGDIQTDGANAAGAEWTIGIRNPLDRNEIAKIIRPRGAGVATSGTAARGSHIYDPHQKRAVETDVASLTVIGPNVYEADRFATAAFAMGRRGIEFLEGVPGLEAYEIDTRGMARMTSGFGAYVC